MSVWCIFMTSQLGSAVGPLCLEGLLFIQSDFPPISWTWYRAWPSPIMSGFHGAFATDLACQQGTLTLPDIWFRPRLWDLLVLQLLRPDSSNLPCLYSTFHLEYPLVLSRFCLQIIESLATDAASQQSMLTPPDTWSCPIWYLHLF